MRIAFFGDLVAPSQQILIRKDIGSRSDFDFAVANLEGSVGTIAEPIKKLINLSNDKEVLHDLIKTFNIEYVNLANNHVMDFGQKGLKQLLNILDDHGIGYFGAGVNSSTAEKPLFLSYGDTKIALLGFSWAPIESVGATSTNGGVARIPKMKKLAKRIESTRNCCSHVVVIFHWGYEFERYPLPLQRKLAHEAIESGASLVIGHHPHVFQGIEIYKGAPVYYSLGDFCLPVEGRKADSIGIIPVIEFSNNALKEVALIRVVYDYLKNELSLDEASGILVDIESLSKPLMLEDRLYNRFFRKNRTRKRGLPVFTGDFIDNLRYPLMNIRSGLVKLAVKKNIYKRTR